MEKNDNEGSQRMEEDINVNTETKKCLSSSTDTTDNGTDHAAGQALSEHAKGPDEPSGDWFEPLEEDFSDEDNQSCDLDIESLAGSERSGSVAGSERNHAGSGTTWSQGGGAQRVRGDRPLQERSKTRKPRRHVGDEDWEDWPILGEGWKRKVVFRRSGMSMGQFDTYYMSPKGERVRSKIEMLKCFKNKIDLTNFNFRKGKFFDGELPKRCPRGYKLDELFEQERNVRTAMTNRAGLLALMLHQTIQHDPLTTDLRSNKDR